MWMHSHTTFVATYTYMYLRNPYMKQWYRIYRKYLARQARANSVDPDENVVSHQGLLSLPLVQQFLDTTTGSKL